MLNVCRIRADICFRPARAVSRDKHPASGEHQCIVVVLRYVYHICFCVDQSMVRCLHVRGVSAFTDDVGVLIRLLNTLTPSP